MFGSDGFETLFAVTAFLFQLILIAHFALRKWRFDTAMRWGPAVYALSIPAAAVSVILLLGDKTWSFWLGGYLFLVWAVFGFIVEYAKKIEWRNSLRYPILIPYVFLYLSTVMFYWFPLGLINKPLWYAYGVLFCISTFLNVTSHKSAKRSIGSAA